MVKRYLSLAILLGAAAACDRGPEEVPAEVRQARHDAARLACLSAELATSAESDLQTLSDLGAVSGAGVVEFSRARHQHALLRQAAYAQLDSALNHSRTPEDSARHAQAAARYTIRTPSPETVEANVVVEYERRLGALLADADHPCNWDLEE